MKRLAITLFAFFILSQNYAQPCRNIELFGVINDATDTTEWLSFSNAMLPNPSYWSFRSLEGQASYVPFLSVQNNIPGYVVVATPCVSLDPTTTYKLNFTFVGLRPGFLNELSVYLVGNTPALVDGVNPLTPASNRRLLRTFTNLFFGTTELTLLITQDDFLQIAGSPESYRIAFRSGTVSRPSPADGNYVIQSFLTNISLSEAQNYNLELVAMTSPLSSCNLNNEILTFTVRNRGFEMPATYSVLFRISTDDGTTFGNWLSQEFTDAIPFNEVVELRLTEHPQTFTASQTTIQARINNESEVLTAHVHRTTTQTVPYSQSFDNPIAFGSWTIASEKTIQPTVRWGVPLEAGGAMSGRAVIVTSGEASNDRLVSGCIQLEAGTRYQISFTYSALVNPNRFRPNMQHATDQALATRENLRFFVGRSNLPSDSDITLMDLRGFNNTDERTLTLYFTPTESGTHFFGFLAYSDAASAGISISEFSIVEAPEPRTLPVFMSFESYDNHDGWQMFSHNTIDSAVTVNVMRGWQLSTAANDRAHGGAVGLRTLSSPALAGATNSIITQSEDNNNWLISPPIYMTAGDSVEIRYFIRSMTNIPAGSPGEILNIRVSEILEIDSLYRLEPVRRDTVRSTTFAERRAYFVPEQSGVFFVTFQYNSQNRRTGTQGMSLDQISIQCSVRAQEINLSAVQLRVPPPACELSTFFDFTQVFLDIKNRTNNTIDGNSIVAYFEITNPQGEVEIRRSTHPATIPQIQPYQTLAVELRTGNDMRAIGTWSVRAWISGDIDQDASDDTTAIVQTASTGTHIGRYDMGFEPHENLIHWGRSQIGNPRFWWSFVNNVATAHTGVGSAFVAPTATFVAPGDTSRQFIISPCLQLASDTTYFISFFFRKAQDYNGLIPLNPVAISTYIRESLDDPDYLINTVSVGSMEYRQHSFFFRPDNTGVHYVILRSLSPRWSTGVFLDNFVILDSVSATTPNLALNRIWVASENTCDYRSDDTLYVELVNNGFMQVVNPTFNIQIRGQNFPETWQGVIPSDSAVIIRLNQRLTHTAFGETSVTVALTLENNRAQQTSLTASSIKTAPIRPPFTIDFQTASGAEILGWNNLALPLNELMQPTFEYWSIGANGAVFRANHQRFLSGILASNCFILEGGEEYVITYEYRGTSSASPENLQVKIERADGTIEVLYADSDIRSATFASNAVRFEASGQTGEEQVERIRFFSNYNHLATGIYIRSFSIKLHEEEDTLPSSLVDFHAITNLLQIHPNPATTEVFIQSEDEISMVFIHDVRGQLVREIRVNSTEYHLNTTDFPAGVYVFTVVIGNAHVSQRIIIND